MVAIGFIGGTVGYLELRARILALHSPMADAGLLIYRHVSGYGEFSAAGIYAACFGLLTRRSSGRLIAALVAWLATVCAGLMVAGISEPVHRAGEAELWAGACGGLVAGLPIALYVCLSGLAEKRQKHLGPSRFSLATMLMMVVGFVLLFAGMRLRGDYLRWRFQDLDSRGVERVTHETSQSLSAWA